ncbi:MAG: ribbon-helix-helix protein, CopG family [Gemmatimonadetes bacterium]|nr:ribbon-helix-helix protein, CopG family [Gemmatimonadota bacterium]
MAKAKIAITLDGDILIRIDQLVHQARFRNRSQAIEAALQEKLERLRRTRLAAECARLDAREEQALAEEGLTDELGRWPDY